MISDWWAGLETFFQPDKEILIAASSEDVIQALNLEENELNRLGTASQQRAMEEHTAVHRAAELVALIEAGV